jgi:hypothetical protein
LSYDEAGAVRPGPARLPSVLGSAGLGRAVPSGALMAVRIDCREDLSFEIYYSLDSEEPVRRLPPVKGLKKAQELARYMIKRMYLHARDQRYTPQVVTEGRQAFKELERKIEDERKASRAATGS